MKRLTFLKFSHWPIGVLAFATIGLLLGLVVTMVGTHSGQQVSAIGSHQQATAEQRLLGIPTNLLVVPQPGAGNEYLANLSWSPAPNAQSQFAYAAKMSEPYTSFDGVVLSPTFEDWRLLGIPTNLLVVPQPGTGNEYLVNLTWSPAPNAQSQLAYAAKMSQPYTPINNAVLSCCVGELEMTLAGGETYVVRVGARIRDTASPLHWTWSEWSVAYLPELDAKDIDDVLPDLLDDDLGVVYVIDTSGSMGGDKLSQLLNALAKIYESNVRNSRVALVRFSDSAQILFNLTEPGGPSWDEAWLQAIPAITAYGGTNIYGALQVANGMLPDAPVCPTPTSCRDRRIVLMSDGETGDGGIADSTIAALVAKGIKVDTVAFGDDADVTELQRIATSTGGRFVRAKEN